jgi:hypothetical protein
VVVQSCVTAAVSTYNSDNEDYSSLVSLCTHQQITAVGTTNAVDSRGE